MKMVRELGRNSQEVLQGLRDGWPNCAGIGDPKAGKVIRTIYLVYFTFQNRDLQTFSVKGHNIFLNILGLKGHTVDVTTTRLCCELATDSRQTNGCDFQ